jgi:hypothetical protein
MPGLNGAVPSLGLLHILEDTVGLLEGVQLKPQRRNYVLRKSKELFAEAEEGASETNSTFVEPSSWRALESFMVISRYLNQHRMQPDNNALRDLASVLQKVEADEQVSEDLLKGPIQTLRTICERMSRDISKPMAGPSEKLRLFAP